MRPLAASEISVVTLAGIQGVTVFTTLLPAVAEVKRADPNVHTSFANDVRTSEIMSTIITMGVAFLVSWLMKTELPVYVGAVSCAALVGVYESLLRRNNA